MAVKRITVHCVEVEDAPGGLQKLLVEAASGGVDLQCFAAFSAGGGRGKVYLSGKNPKALEVCAEKAGISVSSAAGFIISGDDRVGAAAAVLEGLADAGINGVAGAAIVCDSEYRMLIVVDAADGESAAAALGG